jgi:DNA-binding transcriptional LysR family regulator
MSTPDLNLLLTLDVLLREGSVVGAARRLNLSPSAMSRALARLREATGDPLLVRAGRGLVPSPRALALRDRVRQVVDEAEAVLRPALKLDLATLDRRFAIRSTEGFVETFGPGILARVAREAPQVRLWFMPKPDKDSGPLRDGQVDLETGVISGSMGPELRTLGLFPDRFIAVVRKRHPLAKGTLTAERYAAACHVLVARRGLEMAPVDEALAGLGLRRQGVVTVGGFGAALVLAGESDMVATVPERHTRSLWRGMHPLPLPFDVPEFTVSLIWHPRMDADPAHRWLRNLVVNACRDSVDA